MITDRLGAQPHVGPPANNGHHPERRVLFDEAMRLLDRYYWLQARAGSREFDPQVLHEMRDRLKQLNALLSEIEGLQAAILDAAHGERQPRDNRIVAFGYLNPPGDPDTDSYELPQFRDADRLRLSVEAFYYFAHRLVVLIRQAHQVLPGVEEIEADGVKRVRNNLIEHANKQDGVRTLSFSISDNAGPRLRSIFRGHEEPGYVDQGLIENAYELREELEEALRNVAA